MLKIFKPSLFIDTKNSSPRVSPCAHGKDRWLGWKRTWHSCLFGSTAVKKVANGPSREAQSSSRISGCLYNDLNFWNKPEVTNFNYFQGRNSPQEKGKTPLILEERRKKNTLPLSIFKRRLYSYIKPRLSSKPGELPLGRGGI